MSDGGQVCELLDPKRVRELLNSPLTPSNFAPSRRTLEMVLNLEEWMRRYPARLRLDA
jgi:asparagine synthase (glutamine-hydrolysing)